MRFAYEWLWSYEAMKDRTRLWSPRSAEFTTSIIKFMIIVHPHLSIHDMGQFTGDTVLDNRSNHEWDLGLCNSIPPSPPLLPPWRAMRLISIFFSPSEGLFHNSFFDQCLLLLFCDRKDRQGNRNNNASRDLFTWKYLLSPAARSLLSTAYM